MRIGAIATATGISRDTLRFYEKRGLLRARRTANGYRDYPPEALEWLRYIRTAQSLGFTLAEIEAELPLLAAPAEASGPVLRAALAAELARRLRDLPAECPLAPGDQAASARPGARPASTAA